MILDLTQTIDEATIKTRISALHAELGYRDEGPHIGHSIRLHLRAESVSSCDDKWMLLEYDRYLEGKKNERENDNETRVQGGG